VLKLTNRKPLISVKAEKSLSPRFIEIDSLRFIACSFVIIQHGLSYFSNFSTQSSFLGNTILIFSPGWIGVAIFFSISGFVIPSSLKGPRLNAVKVFLKRRFFRLYPVFWVACFTIILLDQEKYPILNLIWRASMLPIQDRNEFGHSSYFWTLHIELVFYFITSLLFLLSGRFTWRFLVSTFSISTISYAIWIQISGGRFAPFFNFSQCLPFSLLLMLWGSCCRAILNEYNPLKLKNNYSRAIKIGLTTGMLTILPLHAIYFGVSEWTRYQLHEGSVTILAIFIFLFFAILKPIRLTALARLGKNTYSTYLFHGAVNLVLFELFSRLGITNYPLIVILIIALACSFIIGELFYKLIEIPINSLGRDVNFF